MLFNSFEFLVFFIIVCFIYYLLSERFQKYWLLGCGFLFYGLWNWKYLLLILFVMTISYVSGLIMARGHKNLGKNLSIVLCIGVLICFKYLDWCIGILNNITNLNIRYLNVILPVGISFYTFQAISYVVDVYRDMESVEKNFINYALYISFFPQLVAGPIERSKSFLRQIDKKHMFKKDNLINGLLSMLWGYFMKMVIAERIALVVNTVYEN